MRSPFASRWSRIARPVWEGPGGCCFQSQQPGARGYHCLCTGQLYKPEDVYSCSSFSIILLPLISFCWKKKLPKKCDDLSVFIVCYSMPFDWSPTDRSTRCWEWRRCQFRDSSDVPSPTVNVVVQTAPKTAQRERAQVALALRVPLNIFQHKVFIIRNFKDNFIFYLCIDYVHF